jgi:Ser/Thr protein kinase RdoA (MazF antagonist)
MQVHDLSGGDEVLARMTGVAQKALESFDVAPDSSVSLLNVSENATYRVDDSLGGDKHILRVHRLGYHTRAAIESELAWLDALREQAGVRTPHVIPTTAGERVVAVPDPEGGEPRHVVMFEFLPGHEPTEDRLVEDFEELGRITARMHQHARTWSRPPAFTRFSWDYDAAFGQEARWGRWQDGAGVGPAELGILGRLDATLQRRLAAFGQGPERFGLVHADTRLANLLVDETPEGRAVSVIDFDDSGFSWYLYDLGTAVSFIEHHPQVPELLDSWVHGYRQVLELSEVDENEIWTFVMFRRLLLVAWIGSHGAVEIAQELGAGYTVGSCELAERYLSRFG